MESAQHDLDKLISHAMCVMHSTYPQLPADLDVFYMGSIAHRAGGKEAPFIAEVGFPPMAKRIELWTEATHEVIREVIDSAKNN